MQKLDKTDLKILQLLQEDADLTNKEVAAHLGMSITPVFERIKKLKRNKFIKKVVAVVDQKAIGLGLTAFCNVSLKEHATAYLEKFVLEVKQLEEVKECYHIAGNIDYLLKVVVEDIDAYHIFITKKLADLDNLGNVKSAFVMHQIK